MSLLLYGTFCICLQDHKLDFGGGVRGAIVPLPVFFLPKNSFLLATELKRGQKMGSDGNGVYLCLGLIQTNLPPLSKLAA
jgi:hypothetical protein